MSATTTSIPSWVAPSLIASPDACTLSTCPLSMAHLTYRPTLPGNALFAGLFGLCLGAQILLSVRYRIWGFLGGMFGGIVLEVIGYIGRILMYSNPFIQSNFLMYLICLTIGPAFLSAAVYLCLARLVVVYGEHLSRFTPRFYTITFITFDFIALLLQAAGGALAATANTYSSTQTGIHIMVAGVAWQVASLGFFAIFCAEFAWRVSRTAESQRNPDFATLRHSIRFQAFLWALGLATLGIFVRSVFRCAELQSGFHGTLAQEQIPFMILEGVMIISSVLLLTVFHPGLSFQGGWHDAAWNLRKASSVEPIKQSAGGTKWTSRMLRKKKNTLEDEKIANLGQAPQYEVQAPATV
ncbi:hypothetical protein MMC13_007432 [Lambiella insularis]|nr:hypothetical protein [Lambiella insularis]